MSLVLNKPSELSRDDVQLAALNNPQQQKLDGTEDKKQLIECSDSKNFDNIRCNIRCVFLLLITRDVVVLVVVVSHVDLVKFPSYCRFSVLWSKLLLHPQPPDTIQECPQGGLQVW